MTHHSVAFREMTTISCPPVLPKHVELKALASAVSNCFVISRSVVRIHSTAPLASRLAIAFTNFAENSASLLKNRHHFTRGSHKQSSQRAGRVAKCQSAPVRTLRVIHCRDPRPSLTAPGRRTLTRRRLCRTLQTMRRISSTSSRARGPGSRPSNRSSILARRRNT